MSVLSKTTTASTLLLWGGVGLGVWWLATRERDGVMRPVTPDATNAYWMSPLGDLTVGYMDWVTNGWGSYQYSGNAAADLQDRFNSGSYGSL